MAELSVIVPMYNTEKYIEQCINSIRNQTMHDIDIIIVDDGSTDKSLELCKKIGQKDNRIKIIHQDNKGLAGARMTGIQNTRTKYATFVDADDFILPNAYIQAIQYMREDIDEIFFEISRYYDDNMIKREYHVIDAGVYDKEKIVKDIYPKLIWNFERKTPGIECSQCVRIVKTELLNNAYKKLGHNRFYYGEDIAITYPLVTCINSMAVIPQSFYMHRQRGKGDVPGYIVSSGYFEEVFRLCNYVRKEMKPEYCGYDFGAQIDYFYMYSVELKKLCYNDYFYSRDFLFPFDKIPVDQRILLYGAGDVGKAYYEQISKINYCAEVLWVDRNANDIMDDNVMNLSVLDEKKSYDVDWIVIAVENSGVCQQIKRFLVSKGYNENKIIY